MFSTLRAGLIAFSVLALTAFITPPPIASQSISCLSQNGSHNTSLRSYLVRLVTAPPGTTLDSVRVRYQLPAGPASSVVIQKQKNLCTQAGQAYHLAITESGTPQVPRQIAVVKVGSNRYVVWDPTERFGEFAVRIVFDGAFVKLLEFTG